MHTPRIRACLFHGPVRIPVPRHAIPNDYARRRRATDRPAEHGPQAVPAAVGWSAVAYLLVAGVVLGQIILAVLEAAR